MAISARKTAAVGSDVVRRGGRPTRTQSEQLEEKILDAATHLFLSLGYGSTSIEAVSRRAGISKRTFYHRLDGKPAPFAAVDQRIVKLLRPHDDLPRRAGDNTDDVLHHPAGPL